MGLSFCSPYCLYLEWPTEPSFPRICPVLAPKFLHPGNTQCPGETRGRWSPLTCIPFPCISYWNSGRKKKEDLTGSLSPLQPRAPDFSHLQADPYWPVQGQGWGRHGEASPAPCSEGACEQDKPGNVSSSLACCITLYTSLSLTKVLGFLHTLGGWICGGAGRNYLLSSFSLLWIQSCYTDSIPNVLGTAWPNL